MGTENRLDKYGRPTLTIDEGINALLEGNSIDGVLFKPGDDIEKFNSNADQILGEAIVINEDYDLDVTVDEYHTQKTGAWLVPDKYNNIDVLELLISRCNTNEELSRVAEEYGLFEERDLIPLLRFLLFLVDHLRANKYIWGVGRGSSVASYILYLIGVHKIDSIKYDLQIEEFLR